MNPPPIPICVKPSPTCFRERFRTQVVVYTQTLTPPRVSRTAVPQPAPREVTDRDVQAVAPLTITYRIENAVPPR
jgi:hypothetical protein